MRWSGVSVMGIRAGPGAGARRAVCRGDKAVARIVQPSDALFAAPARHFRHLPPGAAAVGAAVRRPDRRQCRSRLSTAAMLARARACIRVAACGKPRVATRHAHRGWAIRIAPLPWFSSGAGKPAVRFHQSRSRPSPSGWKPARSRSLPRARLRASSLSRPDDPCSHPAPCRAGPLGGGSCAGSRCRLRRPAPVMRSADISPARRLKNEGPAAPAQILLRPLPHSGCAR